MSRAFVKEDGPDQPGIRAWGLPPRDDPGFPLAAARALLAGANTADTVGAEAATGYVWGDPALLDPMRILLAEALDAGDERTETLARRFLRRAGDPRADE